MSKLIAKESTEQVAGNGLLHRGALLGRGLTLAGLSGIAVMATAVRATGAGDFAPYRTRRGFM
jgi:hypothetical protein